MTAELINTTETLLREIRTSGSNQKDIAQTYNLAMRSSEKTDWQAVNKAIIERWNVAALRRIKAMAHSGSCFK